MGLVILMELGGAVSVEFNPIDGYMIPNAFTEEQHVTLSGERYIYRYASLRRWEMSCTRFTKANAEILWNWRIANTQLLFFPNPDKYPNEAFLVRIANDSAPVSRMMNVGWDSYFEGDLYLESIYNEPWVLTVQEEEPEPPEPPEESAIVFFWRFDLSSGSIVFDADNGDYQDTTLLPTPFAVSYLETGISSSSQQKVGNGCVYCVATSGWWGNIFANNPFKNVEGFSSARIGFWAKKSSNTGGDYYLPITDTGNTIEAGFQLLWGRGTNNVLSLYSNSILKAEMDFTCDHTLWHFYEIAWDGSTVYWYLDGVKIGDTPYLEEADIVTTTNTLSFCAMNAYYESFGMDNLMVSFNYEEDLYQYALYTEYPVSEGAYDDIVFWWGCESESGSLVFRETDYVPTDTPPEYHYITAITGVTSTAKVGSSALQLPLNTSNGDLAYINVEDLPSVSMEAMRVGFWLRWPTMNVNQQSGVSITDSSTGFNVQVRCGWTTEDYVVIYFNHGGAGYALMAHNNVGGNQVLYHLNTWMFIEAAWDMNAATKGRIFINGIEVSITYGDPTASISSWVSGLNMDTLQTQNGSTNTANAFAPIHDNIIVSSDPERDLYALSTYPNSPR